MTHPVDDQVVDDPAALVRQQRVLRLAVADAVEVVREQRLEELRARGPLDVQLSHVRDVERAGVGADGEVLGDDALVLDRHLPAGERHHPRAGRDVALVQRRPAQGRAHAATIPRPSAGRSARADAARRVRDRR